MANQKVPKSSNKFFCKACDYTTERESQFNRHILTDKHKRLTMANEKVPKSSKHLCECGKEYVHASSLSKHRKVCTISIKESFLEEKQENTSNDAMLNMFSKMMKENKELRNLMAEQNEKIVDVMENSKPSMTTNNNIINNNQKVN
jgi:hypothetical protein